MCNQSQCAELWAHQILWRWKMCCLSTVPREWRYISLESGNCCKWHVSTFTTGLRRHSATLRSRSAAQLQLKCVYQSGRCLAGLLHSKNKGSSRGVPTCLHNSPSTFIKLWWWSYVNTSCGYISYLQCIPQQLTIRISLCTTTSCVVV